MDIPRKHLHNGFSLPVYGLGTWQMGGRLEQDTAHDADEVAAIRNALSMGITHIDTAEKYGAGHTEEIVGQALQGYDRSKVFLVSKVSSGLLHYDDVIVSCQASLKRLGTDYLDLFLIHRPNPAIPLEETMRAMDKLKAEGLIKEIGVSNFSKETLARAQGLTTNKIVCNQVHYNLMVREPEVTGLLKYCQNNDVMLVAYRPVQKGMLTEIESPLIDVLCHKYNKTYAQIAINWLISQPNVVTLAKTSRLEHLQENLGALGWELEKQDIERLRQEFPEQLRVSDVGSLL